MNEIKHIHLGRQQFTVSLEAYGELRKYLDAIAHQAGDVGADMTEEVELRMAELLTERGVTSDKVVLPKDVTFLKSQLGEPRDFNDKDLDEDDSVEVSNDGSKRLFRDTDEAMIAGVAAGLGKYLDIDTIIIRLIFIALVFAGGSGILLYVILWLLVPEAKTNSDRLQMDGLAVNIDNIKQTIDRADVPGATRRVSRSIVSGLMMGIRVLVNIIGVLIVLIGSALLIADITTFMFGLARGLQVGGIKIFPVNGEEISLLACAFVLIGLMAGMLMVSGLALVRKKWTMPSWALAAVVGVFIIVAAIGSAVSADVTPQIMKRYNNVNHSRSITVAPFKQLNFVSSNMFYVIQRTDDPTAKVHIKSLGSVDTSKISVADKDGVLTIDTSGFRPPVDCGLICPYGTTNAEIVVTVPINYSISSAGAPGAKVTWQ